MIGTISLGGRDRRCKPRFPVDTKDEARTKLLNTGGVNPLLVPLRQETDRTGLELRKSLHCKALRISSAESIVTKRVALAEP